MVPITNIYLRGLDEIEVQISATESRILNDEDYFQKQVNFLTKSILISICTHFESYSKELAKLFIENYNQKIISLRIPKNLILWDVQKKDFKEKDKNTTDDYHFSISDDDIDGVISANPYRVKNCFLRLGIPLSNQPVFMDNIEVIQSIVHKRNQIIHYNKDSSDISLGDLRLYVNIFREVLSAMDSAFENRMLPATPPT